MYIELIALLLGFAAVLVWLLLLLDWYKPQQSDSTPSPSSGNPHSYSGGWKTLRSRDKNEAALREKYQQALGHLYKQPPHELDREPKHVELTFRPQDDPVEADFAIPIGGAEYDPETRNPFGSIVVPTTFDHCRPGSGDWPLHETIPDTRSIRTQVPALEWKEENGRLLLTVCEGREHGDRDAQLGEDEDEVEWGLMHEIGVFVKSVIPRPHLLNVGPLPGSVSKVKEYIRRRPNLKVVKLRLQFSAWQPDDVYRAMKQVLPIMTDSRWSDVSIIMPDDQVVHRKERLPFHVDNILFSTEIDEKTQAKFNDAGYMPFPWVNFLGDSRRSKNLTNLTIGAHISVNDSLTLLERLPMLASFEVNSLKPVESIFPPRTARTSAVQHRSLKSLHLTTTVNLMFFFEAVQMRSIENVSLDVVAGADGTDWIDKVGLPNWTEIRSFVVRCHTKTHNQKDHLHVIKTRCNSQALVYTIPVEYN